MIEQEDKVEIGGEKAEKKRGLYNCGTRKKVGRKNFVIRARPEVFAEFCEWCRDQGCTVGARVEWLMRWQMRHSVGGAASVAEDEAGICHDK
jgi:hypothetical protein